MRKRASIFKHTHAHTHTRDESDSYTAHLQGGKKHTHTSGYFTQRGRSISRSLIANSTLTIHACTQKIPLVVIQAVKFTRCISFVLVCVSVCVFVHV